MVQKQSGKRGQPSFHSFDTHLSIEICRLLSYLENAPIQSIYFLKGNIVRKDVWLATDTISL